MSDPFLAEIIMFGGNFAPRGWAFCDGQLLPISQYSALFSILGTIYGGDGRTTFALPDMRGRVPVHAGDGPGLSDYRLGSKGGRETVTLTTAQLPTHNHAVNGGNATLVGSLNVNSGGATTLTPDSTTSLSSAEIYTTSAPDTSLHPNSVTVSGTITGLTTTNTGNGQYFDIRQPWLSVNFIIALQGVFPSRS